MKGRQASAARRIHQAKVLGCSSGEMPKQIINLIDLLDLLAIEMASLSGESVDSLATTQFSTKPSQPEQTKAIERAS